MESLLSAPLHTFACVLQGLKFLKSLGLAHAHPPPHPHMVTFRRARVRTPPHWYPLCPSPWTRRLPYLPCSLFFLLARFCWYFGFPVGHYSIAKQASLWTRLCPLPAWLRLSLGSWLSPQEAPGGFGCFHLPTWDTVPWGSPSCFTCTMVLSFDFGLLPTFGSCLPLKALLSVLPSGQKAGLGACLGSSTWPIHVLSLWKGKRPRGLGE